MVVSRARQIPDALLNLTYLGQYMYMMYCPDEVVLVALQLDYHADAIGMKETETMY